MKKIGTSIRTKEIIGKYEFNFQKRLGQNFLIDPSIIDKIIQGAQITKSDTVLEIGPGIGSLTQILAQHARQVLAIEIDKKLVAVLEEVLEHEKNVEIIQGDILKIDLEELLEKEGATSFKVVANLPYYITTPIIMNLLEKSPKVTTITVMVQKEVADRMVAVPGTKAYGSLSLAVAYYATIETVTQVPAQCFIPRPKVGSTVIKLTRKKNLETDFKEGELVFRLIRGAFAQRRKTFINSVVNSQKTPYTKDEIIAGLKALDLDVRIRGEALDLITFVELAKILKKMNHD